MHLQEKQEQQLNIDDSQFNNIILVAANQVTFFIVKIYTATKTKITPKDECRRKLGLEIIQKFITWERKNALMTWTGFRQLGVAGGYLYRF